MLCALIGFLNGWITIRFDIPSFITTLGMLFMARSMTVVVSGGFPPRLKPGEVPSWIFVGFVGPWRTVPRLVPLVRRHCDPGQPAAGQDQFRQLGSRDRRLSASGRGDGHSDGQGQDRLLHDLFGACGICRDDPGRCGSALLLPSIGEGMELQAVAAAVIGGTSLAGGIGSIVGGFIGATLIRVIDNGMVMSQVDATGSNSPSAR